MRLGILGGTFNPPHIGHTHAAQAAKDALGLDRVLFVPACTPPHKTIPRGSATGKQRVEMARLAAESVGGELCTIEFEREGKSYTADTIERLGELYPGAEFWLIIGTDMFLTVQSWYQPERIFKAARIAVVARENSKGAEIAAHRAWLEETYGARTDIISVPAVEISSTELRQGDVYGEEYLPQAVLEYIRKNHLYEKQEV